MANVRELNRRISSLRNMQKVMRAMNMISTTKLRKILTRQASLLAFEKGAMEMANEVAMALTESVNPLMNQAAELKRVCVVMFTSDKGLCGSHNNAVQRAVAAFIETLRTQNVSADTVCIGTRGAAFCRRNSYDVHLSMESSDRALTAAEVRSLARRLITRVQTDEIQQVHFVFNSFVSTLFQRTTTLQVLPLSSLLPKEQPDPLPEFVVEPMGDNFIAAAVELILYYLLSSSLRHSHLSEHAARMTAMDNATNNSEDLINRYGAVRNRARQTQITSELTEIVAGKEALK